MKKYYFVLIFAFSFLGILVLAKEVLPDQINYPVPELGNCASKAKCETYCDQPKNREACLNFAEANNLIPKEEIAMARKMLERGDIGGPGGCKGKEECEAYCDNPDNMEECIEFAKKYGLIPPDELDDVEKVLAAIRKGHRPPPCRGKAACDVYCSEPSHLEQCFAFGEAAGLIPPGEIDDARKALAAVKKGVKPPACRGKAECDTYCSAPEHLEECLTFAEAAGFISSEEAAMARKTGGKGPGNCRGKEECETYCDDPAHAEDCIEFAVKYGFMPAEEAENAKKMLKAGFSGGPGGCKGKEACEAYCNDLSHMEDCVNFAEKMGFMNSEDANRARRMAEKGINVMQGGPGGCKGKEECEAFCQDPANAQTCLDFAVKIGEMTPEQAEQSRKGTEMIQRGGPGGCKSEEDCKSYCEEPAHSEECINFSVQQGFMSPEEAQRMREMMQQGSPGGTMGSPPEGGVSPGMMPPVGGTMPIGPSGCTSETECRQYCQQNPQDSACQAMGPAPGMPPTGMPPTGMPPEMGPPAEGVTPIEMAPQEGQQAPIEITPPPPPTESPQSFFNLVKSFLASVISAFIK